MSLTVAALEILVAKGLSAADILDVARALDVRKDPTAAERQRRRRERLAEADGAGEDCHAVTVTRDVTRDETPTPDKSPPNPQKLTPTPGEHTRETRTRGSRAFPCPEGVNPQHWADFLANRNRKRLANTPTAYRAQLAKLDELSDDEWPPDRIVQFAAARGWGAFFDPRGRDDERRNGHHGMAGDHRASSGLGTTVDAALDFIADVRGKPRH